MDKAVFGLFGSLTSRMVLGSPTAAQALELGFQIGGSIESILPRESLFDCADEAQFLCVDLLDERFETQYSGVWEEKCLQFIDLIKARFSPGQVFLFEFYLAERMETAGTPYPHAGLEYIKSINKILNDKCVFRQFKMSGFYFRQQPL